MVASLRSRLRDTVRWTASTVQGPASHTARITWFSNSVSGDRTGAPDAVRFVIWYKMYHYTDLRVKESSLVSLVVGVAGARCLVGQAVPPVSRPLAGLVNRTDDEKRSSVPRLPAIPAHTQTVPAVGGIERNPEDVLAASQSDVHRPAQPEHAAFSRPCQSDRRRKTIVCPTVTGDPSS